MYFKCNNKLRIIQLYNPSRKHKIINEEIYCKMEHLITTAQIKSFKLIIMGDFNENINKYYRRKIEGLTTKSSKFNLLRLMSKYTLLIP